jgi:predicted site-specific integrase-resolvase
MKELTSKEAAARLGITLRTFQRWRKTFRIRPRRFTGQQPLFLIGTLRLAVQRHDRAMQALARRRANA